MIIITGGEGFIGTNLSAGLIKKGYFGDDEDTIMEIVILDTRVQTLDEIHQFIMNNAKDIQVIFHLGAITDTMEMDRNKFDEYNVNSSIFIWNICTNFNIPLIYASSAATYGDGSLGFDDRKDIIKLSPLNPYGWSKQQFDVWASIQEVTPPRWYGLKFFNVYGYNESHKGNMASVVFHAYNQIRETGKMKLFKSHNPFYRDGEQLRDFIYVDDVVDVMIWLFENQIPSGLYNVGTGEARTFNDLVKAVFNSMNKEVNIEYIDTPKKLRDMYQYFTEAKMNKLREVGYTKHFTSLENGIKKYIAKIKS